MVTTRRLALMACISIAVTAPGIAQSQQGTTGPSQRAAGTPASRRMPPPLKRPPFPHGTHADEILANISHGIKQMRMDEVPGQEALGGPLVAERILDVESGTSEPDYYVVELLEPNGTPLGDVIVGKDGRVRSVWRYQAGAPRPRARDLADVTDRLTKKFGPTRAKYYHAANNIEAGGSFYVPLIVADTPAGRVFVNSKLEMFAEESFKKFSRPPVEEFEDFRKNTKNREQWLVKKDGIGKLKKVGKL